MSTASTARPRQTTMAGTMVMLAATFVVLSVWDTVSRLRSIETRESIESFLANAPGSYLGLSVETTIQAMHAISIVAALCSVAAVALGWQVLQRSRQARAVLSVLAVPLFITGLVAGGFMSSLVAVATAMLWLSPSREWFAGLPIPEPVKPGQTLRDANVRALSGKPAELPPTTLEPSVPSGWSVTAADPAKRPDPVTVAFVLTIVMAGLVFLMTLAGLVTVIAQPDLAVEELRRQNPDLDKNDISKSLVLSASYISAVLTMAWSALAVVLAVFLARRRAWAGKGLLVCASACALVCILATIAQPIALLPACAAIATVSCLRRPDVRAWLDAPR